MHYLTVQSMKSAAVLIEDGAFALFFFVPAMENLAAQVPSHPGICHVRQKKNANYPEGGMGAPGID